VIVREALEGLEERRKYSRLGKRWR